MKNPYPGHTHCPMILYENRKENDPKFKPTERKRKNAIKKCLNNQDCSLCKLYPYNKKSMKAGLERLLEIGVSGEG